MWPLCRARSANAPPLLPPATIMIHCFRSSTSFIALVEHSGTNVRTFCQLNAQEWHRITTSVNFSKSLPVNQFRMLKEKWPKIFTNLLQPISAPLPPLAPLDHCATSISAHPAPSQSELYASLDIAIFRANLTPGWSVEEILRERAQSRRTG